MNIKKTTVSLLSAALVLGVTAGCGSSGEKAATTGNPSASSAPEAKKAVTLTMWGGVPGESGPQAAVDNWNAKNPDIQVKYERFVNDDAGNLKLDTALTTNQGIDLYVNYTLAGLTKRIDAGTALDLSEFKDYNIDDKMGTDAKDWKVKDKYYGLPTKKNVSFVWLNKNALDEAGLAVPSLDWTMDDLQQYAAKLKKGTRWGFTEHISAYPNFFDGANAGAGFTKADGTSNLDDPTVRKAYESMYNMMYTDKSMPLLGEQITSKMPTDAIFLKGETAMLGAGEFIFRSSNNMKDFPRDFKIAFATIPKVTKDQANYKYPGGLGDVISINPNSKNKEQAWKFLKWYADGGMMPLASGGRIPSSKDANVEEAIKLLLGDNEKTYDVDSLKKVVFGKFPTYTATMAQQVIDARREEYEKYFLKAQSLDDTLKNTVKRHNDYLSKNKK
ncbi:ABC transporter substrate-binding protein [Paenibacillus ferrarius]|uniref:ABC transporter substrate-binding protein n=2 Tax=Paenibacillus ferrarius TaxID=1469647 RepID=A0A1V4HIC2_9BACL|nr:extracellular solute-binding protein [Paenibacillus ferrarius]OPH56045.1 ABC transporter substrate-binding protein [Paenibacillus ferrarius]